MIESSDGRIRGLILDMDGVLWRNDQPLGDLAKIFQQIDKLGFAVMYATNNATRSIDQYIAKLNRFGVKAEDRQIINSARSAAYYLRQHYEPGTPIYVVGEQALVDCLDNEGYPMQTSQATVVVAALDRTLSYEKLRLATRLIYQGAQFIATNPDRTFPTPQGLEPGAGAIIAALEAATGQEAIIVGKPEETMYRLALKQMDAKPEEVFVIGDRLETDILGAQRIGCKSALVLSGVTNQIDAYRWQPQPDLIANDLAEAIEKIATTVKQISS